MLDRHWPTLSRNATSRASLVFLFALIAFGLLTFAPAAHAVTAPAGFVVENALPGAVLSKPVQVVFLPDGRKLIVEQDGRIWTFLANGAQVATPFLDLQQKVLGNQGRGLLGVAIDPDFANDPWVYVTYTVDPDSNGVDSEIYTWSRVERYRADALDPNVADLSTRQILIGGSWPDGIPVLDTYHVIGMMRFAADGTLLIASGDAGRFNTVDAGGLDPGGFGPGKADPAEDLGAFRSQTIDSMCGKILRIDPDTGLGLPSNPFFDGDPASNRSRVWHYGVRNAFRFAIRPGTGAVDPTSADVGALYIADVGWNTYEELNITTAPGLNLGWPCEEGPLPQSGYQNATQPPLVGCTEYGSALNPVTPTGPVAWWHHSNSANSSFAGWTGNSASGGVFVEGSNYPAPYEGSYFVGDYAGSWVRSIQVDASNNLLGSTDFLTGANGPVNMEQDPTTGDLWYAAIQSNEVRRIRYVGQASADLQLLTSARADSADGSGPAAIPSAASPWVDLVGPHDLTLNNFAGTAASGWQGNGTSADPYRLQLDGANDRLTVPAGSIPELQAPVAYSTSMWVKTGANVTTNQYVAEWLQVYSSPYNGMTLAVANGNLRIFLNPWQDVQPVSPNTWYHVAVAKEAGEVRVYVDGELAFTSPTPNFGAQVSEVVLGASTFNGAGVYGNHFGGSFGQVRIWQGAMELADVIAEYGADQPLYQPTVPAVPVAPLFFARADSADGFAPYASPGAASPWVDLRSPHDLTLNNFGGTVASGWVGDGTPGDAYRLNFDGSDDRLTIPAGSIPELQFATSYTAEMWFRTGTDITRNQYLMEFVQTYGVPYAGMTFAVRDGSFRVYLSPWYDVAPVQPNTWYHVVLAKEAGQIRVYVNGVLEFTNALPNIGAQVSEVVVGASTFRGAGSYGEHFEGDIAQVGVFQGAFDDTRAVDAYQASQALYGTPDPPQPTGDLFFARADSASGNGPYAVPGAASPWVDIRGPHDLTLTNFAGTASSGWNGDGSPADPYRLQFDGVDDRLTIPAGTIPALQSPTEYSASMWFKTSADIASNQYLMEWVQTYGSPYAGMTFAVRENAIKVFLNPWQEVMPVQPDTWYHLVVAKQAGAVNVYVDGLLEFTSATPNIGSQVSEVVVGASTFRGAGTYGEHFEGAIAQIRAWDFQLDATRALVEYGASSALYPNSPPPPATLTHLVSARADSASGTGPHPVPSATSPWVDLVGPHDLTLVNFAGDATSGWLGDGSVADPYRLKFDGVDDIATIPAGSIPELQNPARASMEMWFRTGTDVTTHQYLLEYAETYSNPWAGFTMGIENGVLRQYLGGAWGVVSNVQPETWYYVAVVKDATEVRVYLDGQLAYTSPSVNLGSQNSEVVLGAGTFAGVGVYDRFFTGSIAQFSLWEGVLSELDVQARYDADKDLYVPPFAPTGTLFFARADSANGTGTYAIPSATSPWVDLIGPHDLTLSNFAGDTSGGWIGDGTTESPYRLRFDGVDDRVTIPAGSIPELQSPTAYSVSMWFRTGGDVTSIQYLFEWLQTYTSPYAGMTFAVRDGELQAYLNPWQTITTAEPFTWYHMAVAKEAGEVRVYVDGERLFTSASPNIGAQLSEVVVGASTFRGAGTYGNWFGGEIAQVRAWDVTLDDTAALADYDASKALYQVPPPPPALTQLVCARADSASGTGPHPVPGAASPWVDLIGPHDVTLTSFAGDTSSGWLGDGTVLDPYRLQFDGVDDIATIPGGSIPGLQSPLEASVEVWFRTGADVTRQQYVFEMLESFTSPYRGFKFAVENGNLQHWLGAGWAVAAPVQPDTWYYAAITKVTGDSVRVYVDGVQVDADASVNLGSQNSEIVLGAGTFAGPGLYDRFFEGAIAQFCVWQGVLPAQDVATNYLAGRDLYVPPTQPNLVALEIADPAVAALDSCFTVAAVLQQNLATPLLGASVSFTLSSELELCDVNGIEAGTWLDGYTNVFFDVIDEGAGSFTVDQSLLGAPCGVAEGDTLFTIRLRGLVENSTATVTIDAVDVRDCAGDPVATDAGAPLAIEIGESSATGIGDAPLITRTMLMAPVPNPFNPRTELSYVIAKAGRAQLVIYSVGGRRVRTLVDETLEVGRHSVVWNGTDDAGRGVASGVYLARLIADGESSAQRMVLLQ